MNVYIKHIVNITAILLFLAAHGMAGIGQSAIITLSFPFGARTTGMGETFTGIANSLDATFYNPAGLGQTPLTNVWKAYYPVKGDEITAIAAKRKKSIVGKDHVWIGTNSKGLMLYNGKVWTSYEIYQIEEGDDLSSIAKKSLSTDDNALIAHAIKLLRKENDIETKRLEKIKEIILPSIKDPAAGSGKRLDFADSLANAILELDKFNRTAPMVYGIIVKKVDSLRADSLSNEIADAFSIEDKQFSDLVDLKIPFTIAVRDTVTALLLDAGERVWVGTKSKGVWRYDGTTWTNYSILDGLPSNTITALASGQDQKIAVGTDNGAGLFAGGQWSSFTVSDTAERNDITAITFGKDDALYIGTATGLYKKNSSGVIFYDTASGLLSSTVSSLFFDSQNKLWIGGPEGLTLYDEITWKRYRFPGSKINCFDEYKTGRVWIGTTKGAIVYKRGRVETDKEGRMTEAPPEWKVYHSKNALKGDNIKSIAVHGKNLWLTTENGVNQLEKGEIQGELFFEPLLPVFEMPELWHAAVVGVIPIEEWGTIGLYLNYLNFGKNEEYDAQGKLRRTFNSYEFVFALCYGILLRENFSLGLNIKIAYSALAPGTGEGSEGTAKTFAIDAAILKRNLFIKNLNLGFALMNMGPAVSYVRKDEDDPIPFTARLGLSYNLVQTPVHNLLVAVDLDREIVKKNPYGKSDNFWKAIYTELINDTTAGETWKYELEQVIAHIGIEWWYVNFLALRMGYMHDEVGSRKEISFGIGLKYANMNIDWSYIYASESMSPARNGQWRFSFIYSY